MRKRSSPPTFWGAAAHLGILLFLAALLESMLLPSVRPSRGSPLGEMVAFLIVLAGAWDLGRKYYEPLLFTAYGMLGGCLVGVVFLPDYYGNVPSLAPTISSYSTCVVIMGFACRGLGKLARMNNEWRDEWRDPAICPNCGYLLYGLPAKRCPECGEAFTGPVPQPPTSSEEKTPPSSS